MSNKLPNQLRDDFEQFNFTTGDDFYYQSSTNTIFYNPNDDNCELLLLHELSHALLKHSKYNFDIELIKMEADAWNMAKNLAKQYAIDIDTELINQTLETYRDWLFARSQCPKCGSAGAQRKDLTYHCIECQTKWRTNDAKFSSLRRTKLK